MAVPRARAAAISAADAVEPGRPGGGAVDDEGAADFDDEGAGGGETRWSRLGLVTNLTLLSRASERGFCLMSEWGLAVHQVTPVMRVRRTSGTLWPVTPDISMTGSWPLALGAEPHGGNWRSRAGTHRVGSC